jgi:CBS domain-containing protein
MEENTMTTCGQIMSKNLASCLASDTADKAAKFMKTENVGSIPVVESQQSQKLVGIVTDRDLALNVVAEGRDPRSTRVEQVMTRNPVTCLENDDLQKAMNFMTENQVRRIPIVDKNGRLVGIVAQADIATRTDNPQKTAEVVEEISKPAQATTR